MKIALLLCALVLSASGWCASAIPSERIARAATPTDQTIGIVMIGWSVIFITYLTVIIWWTVATKDSLDNILKEVLQSLAKYS